MAKFSFALSDKLCKEYMLFKQHGDYDKSLISKLLRYYNGIEFIYNNDQLKRVNITVDDTLSITLKKAGLDKKDIEELSAKTEFQLILTDDKSEYPYVNIYSDNIETCLTGCFYQKENRNKAIEHIKSLCKRANKITIYDKFISENSNYLLLKDIIPNKAIEVSYVNNHLDDKCLKDLESTLNECIFKEIKDTDTQHHDRYIIINDKLEIILSSGFEHLKGDKKEIIYIVRNVDKNRLTR